MSKGEHEISSIIGFPVTARGKSESWRNGVVKNPCGRVTVKTKLSCFKRLLTLPNRYSLK